MICKWLPSNNGLPMRDTTLMWFAPISFPEPTWLLVSTKTRSSGIINKLVPYRGNDTIFCIFPIVPCHAFCTWHWPICKDLDLSFIWGHHHLHLVVCEYQWTSCILHSLLHRAEETQQSRNSCPRLQFGFQFGLYGVIAPLSFQRSISLASLCTSLSIFG